MRDLLPVDLHVVGGFLPVDHIEKDGLHGGLIASLLFEGDDGSGSRLHRDLCLSVHAVPIFVAHPVVLVEGKGGVHIRCQKDLHRGHGILCQVHQPVCRHRDDGAALDKKRDAGKVHRDLDRLAGLIRRPVIEVIKALLRILCQREADGARRCPLLHDACNQDVVSEHEVHALVIGFRIVLERHKHGLHDRKACDMGPVDQGVQVRGETVAEGDGIADVLLFVAVHPGLRDGIVRVRGVDREAGHEDPVLHPSDKELSLRCRAKEAAHIRADIGNAGEAHAQHGRDVVLQGLPAGQVVPGPHLGVALNAGMTGAADGERAHLRVVLLDRLIRELAHDVAHDGLEVPDRAALSLKEDLRILVHQAVVLAVVIPDGLTAVL